MKQKTLSILAIALTAVLATACTRQDDAVDTTAGTDATVPADTAPATTTDPSTTMPADATAGTMPDATTGTTTAGTEPPTTTPPTTMGDASASMTFSDMDKNSDGSITQDELADTDSLRQNFSSADKDGDGKLSQAEVDAQRASTTMPPGG